MISSYSGLGAYGLAHVHAKRSPWSARKAISSRLLPSRGMKCLASQSHRGRQTWLKIRAEKGVCTLCTPWVSDWVVSVSVWGGLGRFSGEASVCRG